MNLACFTKTPFLDNPLETKDDLRRFCTGILDPLAAHTSPGGARVHLGFTGTHFDETAAQLEGFSRPIWALAALLAGGGQYEREPRKARPSGERRATAAGPEQPPDGRKHHDQAGQRKVQLVLRQADQEGRRPSSREAPKQTYSAHSK